MRKYEMALMLARKYGYTSYLEICTPTTGGTFSQVDKDQFTRRVRLMYRRPSKFSDGEIINYSTESESGEELFGKVMRSGEKFDIVFIDSFHTYAASLRDLVFAMQLVKKDGLILIHDCFPPDEVCTAPNIIPGCWCGLTFAAYLDIVLFTEGIHYVTVDSDYGCGIISKDDRLADFSDVFPSASLILKWRTLSLPQKYSFFEKHHSQLLRLISVNEFHERLFGELYQSRQMDAVNVMKDPRPSASAGDFQDILKETTSAFIDVRNELENTQTSLTETTNDLLAVRHDLNNVQSNLAETINDLAAVRHTLERTQETLTWRLHDFITNRTIVGMFYQAFVSPVKRYFSKTT